MKTSLNRLIICSVVIVGCLYAQTAWAEVITGKVDLLQTNAQSTSATGVVTTSFDVRVTSTCGADRTPTPRIVTVRLDARPDAPDSNDVAVNFKNAYSTLLAALLAGHEVQIFSPQLTCDSIQSANFRNISIGIFVF